MPIGPLGICMKNYESQAQKKHLVLEIFWKAIKKYLGVENMDCVEQKEIKPWRVSTSFECTFIYLTLFQ